MPSSGAMSTARGFYPPGTTATVCIAYNRALKAARIVLTGWARGLGVDLTGDRAYLGQEPVELSDEDIDALADAAGSKRPGSEETRSAVRSGLVMALDSGSDAERFRQAVLWSAESGEPLAMRDGNDRRVLLVPLPIQGG